MFAKPVFATSAFAFSILTAKTIFFIEIVFGTVLCGMFVRKGRDCFCKMFCCLSWLESGTLTSTSYRLSKQVLAPESTAVQKSSSASHFRLRLASLDSVSETNLTSRHSAGCKLGCSGSLLLHQCAWGHSVQRVCTSDELGKRCHSCQLSS